MIIEQILDKKGRRCATVAPEALVARAVAMLAEERIGAVVVETLKGAVVGIFSERDLVRELARRGPGVLDIHVQDLMTSPVISCRPEDRVDAVMAIMAERHIRHMPVIKDGKLSGMVSIRDMVRERLSEKEMEAATLLDISRLHA